MKITIEIGTSELKIIRPALRRYFNEKAHTSIEELIMMAVRHIVNGESGYCEDWKPEAVCDVVPIRRSNWE